MNSYLIPVMAVLLLCMAAVLLWFHLETKRFIVKKYTVSSKKLPGAFDGVKLALIADLHNNVFGRDNQRLLAALERENPDYILIAGDMLVAKPGEDFTPAVEFLREISSRYPVYYSYGNHESRLGEKKEYYGDMAKGYEKAIAGFPLIMLHNRSTQIVRCGESITVYGLEIGKEYYHRFKRCKMTGLYLTKKLGKAAQSDFSILIAHNPFYFPAYAEWGADLVVSGHNHGGIARLPFLGGLIDPNLRIFPEYDRGMFQKGTTQMILSAGNGSHSPNFRAFNPPELVIITLNQKKEE